MSKKEIERRIVEHVLGDYKKYGFGRLAVELKGENKFIGLVLPENIRSIRVLEKLGFE